MVELPVRVELREKVDNAYLRFTIPTVQFVCPPSAKDVIEFRYSGWTERELAEVHYVYHACGDADGRGAVVFALIQTGDHGQLLLTFDKFKDSVQVIDLETSSAGPPAYYKLYRTLLRLWGKPTYDHNHDSPQAIGGLVRAALVAGGAASAAPVEVLHTILIEDKKRNRGDNIQLLRLLWAWDKQTGAAVDASTNAAAVLAVALTVFANIRSVRPDQLPLCLRLRHDQGEPGTGKPDDR